MMVLRAHWGPGLSGIQTGADVKTILEILIVACVVGMFACDDPGTPKHVPDIHVHNIGIVTSTDWHDRSFMLQEDGTGIMVWLKSCEGSVPVWPGEHVEVNHRRVEDIWIGSYRNCEELDYVRRLP